MNFSLPHVIFLVEDQANRAVVNGFLLDAGVYQPAVDILPNARGWKRAVNDFEEKQIPRLRRYVNMHLVLVIDRDDDPKRMTKVQAAVPLDLEDRVFILSSAREPEDLRRAGLGNFEAIGLALARDCREGTNETWSHSGLAHNATEVIRARTKLRPILFPPPRWQSMPPL